MTKGDQVVNQEKSSSQWYSTVDCFNLLESTVYSLHYFGDQFCQTRENLRISLFHYEHQFVNILRHIYDMEPKSSQMGALFIPDVCQLRSCQHRQFVHVSDREVFPPNSTKFTVECD